jgi:mannitol/fructose-specific phosphotransferase system IIA component (Ntr-type)
MTYWKLFKAKSCSVELKSATKDETLAEILEGLVEGGALERELYERAHQGLLERERMATTGVGQNVAIPHIQVAGLELAVASLCVHPGGVEWGAVDGEPVQLFFTVLRPAQAGPRHDPAAHLEMMRWIARLGRDRDFRSFALQARTRKDLVDLLKEMSHV